jgi:hypothetical protein
MHLHNTMVTLVFHNFNETNTCNKRADDKSRYLVVGKFYFFLEHGFVFIKIGINNHKKNNKNAVQYNKFRFCND